MKHRLYGFTLIELIFVILLIGILSVVVLPKLSFTDGTSDLVEARDRLLSVLRHSQLQSMQNTQSEACYKVLINNSRFGQQSADCDNQILANTFTPDYLGFSQAEAAASPLQITANSHAISTYFQIEFNSLGVPTESCDGGCRISLTLNNQTQTIYIEPQGYIHL